MNHHENAVTGKTTIIELMKKNISTQKSSTKSVGGRPRKEKYDQRRHHHKVSYNDEEEAIIQMKAEDYHAKDDKYLHDIALFGEVYAHLTEENTEQLREICNMANNTNQIAHAANAAGFHQVRFKAEKLVNMLYDLVQRILRGGDLSEPGSDSIDNNESRKEVGL